MAMMAEPRPDVPCRHERARLSLAYKRVDDNRDAVNTPGMLVVALGAELSLSEPDAKFGLVTWFELAIRDSGDRAQTIGSARVAWIRVADAMNREIAVRAVLDAAGAELADLHDVFFDPEMNCLKERFHNGLGWDVLFVSQVEVAERWRGRNLEEALIVRMAEMWAETCAIVVIPITSPGEIERWGRVGFEIMRGPGATRGYAYLDRATKHPRARARDASATHFEIIAAT